MRAAVLRVHGEAPSHGDHPDPVPAEGQSIVRVTAAPVVPLDLLCASGTSYFGPPEVPYVPGVQGVGVVEESAVVTPGIKVFFATSAGMAPGDGSFAERCAVPDADLVALDTPVPDTEVAAIGLSGVAAWMVLSWRARLQPGERVVVLGGGGAVGQAAIGTARVLGASRVVAVCRSDDARRRALAAGADEVITPADRVPQDRADKTGGELAGQPADTTDLTARLAEATGGAVDVIVDPVFGSVASAAARLLAPGGRLVNLGGASGDEATFSSAILRSRSASILGYTNNAITPDQRRDALTAVLRQAAAGAVTVAHETVALPDITAAWNRQSTGRTAGRLVLTL
ncbi:zinc-binding alcohol dehydrogenase family protein [Kribbella turkmenica]|uniref:Zinc-binding alcohol dehydrogenase family protein n=1 Tax=Kribbella turkmenica TaxID=2530375 RepID=A0A4R4WYJ7_9ACTN|nr:zinc-binding alcohol dehydrogenase family protein [Kribbella turkmenica]TDD22924.1 zinc-binding alcohol dehydrogenase family protein [Kribbella turkmenica]